MLARVDVARALGAVHLFDDALRAPRRGLRARRRACPRCAARALAAELEIGGAQRRLRARRASGDQLAGAGRAHRLRACSLAMAQARAATGRHAARWRPSTLPSGSAIRPISVLASEREKQRVLVHIYCARLRDARSRPPAPAPWSSRARPACASRRPPPCTTSATPRAASAICLAPTPRSPSRWRPPRRLGHERLVSLNRVHLAYLDGVGGKQGAEDELRELVRYADARGYRTDALEGRYLLAALQQRRGDAEGARRALVEVRAEALALGNQLVAEDAREALGDPVT